MKPEERFKTFEPEVQDLCNIINGFDINEKYKVEGLETKLKGIDILAIQDIWVKHLKKGSIWNSNCANVAYTTINPMPKYTPCLIFKK